MSELAKFRAEDWGRWPGFSHKATAEKLGVTKNQVIYCRLKAGIRISDVHKIETPLAKAYYERTVKLKMPKRYRA